MALATSVVAARVVRMRRAFERISFIVVVSKGKEGGSRRPGSRGESGARVVVRSARGLVAHASLSVTRPPWTITIGALSS
jgi:hypothetical protein